MVIQIVISSVSLIFLALFAAIERALGSFNKLRYEVDKKQEKRYALVTEELLDREGELISSLKVATDIFLIIFGVSFSLIFPNILWGVPLAFVTLLLLAKVLPMAVATINAHFIIEHLIFFAKGVLTLISPFTKREPLSHIPEREESNEMVIFQNVLNFSEVKVKECMIPRTEICAISESASIDDLLALFADSKYSRIIVYSDSIDKITGYVHSKDLFS